MDTDTENEKVGHLCKRSIGRRVKDLLDKLLEVSSHKLFHISARDLGTTTTLKPRIPQYPNEDKQTPRVCLSPSIEGCLMGASGQLHPKDNIYYVYELTNSPKIYKPTKEQVYDVGRTGEVWALEDAELRLVNKIEVKGELGSRGNNYYSDYKIVERI